MALRHPMPNAILPTLSLAEEPSVAPPVARSPRLVSFRPGADMEAVAKEVMGFRNVNVTAPVGAGKSTALPEKLAEVSGCRVIHVVPSKLLAVHNYDYLVSCGKGDTYGLAYEVTHNFDKPIVKTYFGHMVALLLLAGVQGKPFGDDVILFLDEIHESDAYTYFLNKVALGITGVRAVVHSSATHTADYMPMREPLGKVDTQTYSHKDKPSTWDPLDSGKPWSISSFEGNALFFVDIEKDAARLATLYGQAGVTVFRLHAKMSVPSFRAAIKAADDPNGGIVVLIADYSFRSGFTLDVTLILDSCIAKYTAVADGEVRVCYRKIYQLERNQGSARGGRTKGSNCVYYCVDVDAEDAICKLEGVEIEAVAVLCRVLGYAPFPEIQSLAAMAKGRVPMDMVTAFNSAIPLQLLDPEALRDLVVKRVRPESVESVSELLANYSIDSPVVEGIDMFSSAVIPQAEISCDVSTSGIAFLNELRAMSGTMSGITPGVHYMCAGLPHGDVESHLYGDDWRTALTEITRNTAIVAGFTDRDRHELIAMLLTEYNTGLAVTNGINAMLDQKASLQAIAMQYPSLVKTWTDRVGADLREAQSKYRSIASVLEVLRTSTLRYVPVDSSPDVVKSVSKRYSEMLLASLGSVRSAVDANGYFDYIASRVEIDGEIDSTAESIVVDRLGGSTTVRIKARPVRVGTKSMQDVTVSSQDSLNWTREEFKDAVELYLRTSGLAAHSIRKLTLMGTDVDSDRIIQELRTEPRFKRRRESQYKIEVARKPPPQIELTPRRGKSASQ